MIKNYLLITFRNLLKNKVFIFINIFGIGLAVACCIVAYLNWEFNHNWDSRHKNAAVIYRLQFWYEFQGNRNRYAMSPMPLGNYIRQNFKDVDKVVRLVQDYGNYRVGDELFSTRLAYVDSAFFEMFTYDLKYGSFADFKDKSKIFINDELALKYFKKEDAVGQPLTQIIDGKPREFIVGGVFAKAPLNSSFYQEAFTLFDNYWELRPNRAAVENDWSDWNTLFIQVNDPARIASITQRLQQYIEPQNKANEDFRIKEYYLENFKGMGDRNRTEPRVLNEWLRRGLPREAINVPTIMAGLLLLLACFNFTNTSIAVSSQRLKEIGIRKVMGGSRWQLILQFLGENLLLCFVGLLAGLVMAEALVPAYDTLWPWLELHLSYSENSGFLIFLCALLFVTAIIAGSYPSFYITSFQPVNILKGKQTLGGTNWFTLALLWGQFSISILTIIFAVAFSGNAEFQKKYDLGYATTGVISVWVDNESKFNTYRDALSSNKDIKVIAGTKNHIANNFYNDPIKYESVVREVDIMEIGEGYFEAMDMKLLTGRRFHKESKADMLESVLVSEEFVKQYGWKDDPIGKRVLWKDTTQLYVVGVIKNVYARALWGQLKPMMLRYVLPDQYNQIVVSMPTDKMKTINEFMEKKWKEVFPNSVYYGNFIDRKLAETVEVNDNVVKIFGFLGFFAIVLSATGLYTLVSLNIIKKMKEIGVRKVLGASMGSIAVVINLKFAVVLAVAGIVGGTSGYFATDLIMDSIWEYYKRLDIPSFITALAMMFFTAAIAVSYKTFITAKMNPVKTLRDE